MKLLLPLPTFIGLLFFCINAHSEQYQCTATDGQIVTQNLPCDYLLQNNPLQNTQPKLNETLDAKMHTLLERPYSVKKEYFLDYINTFDLLTKKDSDGDSVLSIAAINGQADVIKYLVNQGLDVNDVNHQGYTVFSFVAQFSKQVQTDLVKYGANINHVGNDGATPLINAVLSDNINTVDFLISLNVNIDHLDKQGGSPLYYAASIGNIDMVKQLVEAGANVNIGKKRKPLAGSTARGHFNINTYLILHGALQ